VNRARISIIVDLVGSVSSICGLFLPWGTEEWPGFWSEPNYPLGIELALGKLALVGCIITVCFLLVDIKRKSRYSRAFRLLGSMVTVSCALIWIAFPGTLYMWGWPPFKALYGAYVTHLGALVTLINASVQLIWDYGAS
jgi:hypothetical protein